MPNHKIYKLLLTFFISINLVACGGGSDSGGEVSAQTSSQLMAKYSGIKDSASLTVDEIYPTLNYLFNGDTSGFEGITSKSYATAKSSRSFTTRATESFGCSYGGSVTINESLNQKTGIGQVIYDYDNCDGGDYSISGQLVFDYKQWGDDWEPEKYDIIYNEYREEYPDGTYFALDGSIVVWEPSSCYTQTTSNLLYQTDKMSVLERDLKSFNNGCPVETIYIGEIGQAIEGRVYFGSVGYVDIATEDRLNFDESQQVVTGKLSLSNENTLIVLETNDSITSLTVNSYNDPSLDYSASSLSWNYTEQAYSEVRDDDLDGYANVDDFYPDNAELFEPLTISDSNITFSYVYGSNNIISDKLSINGTNIG